MAGAAVVTGCSSSSKPNGAPGATGSTNAGSTGGTYTIGVLSDESGLAASADKYTLRGAQAGATIFARRDGISLKFVAADTQSSPAGALAAAQQLVRQDHVDAVLMVSSLGFAAAPFLTSQGIPVVGHAIDGNEWTTSPNMFSAMGFVDPRAVPANYGNIFKLLGINNVGSIGYGISPSSADAAKNAAASASKVGIKVGYLNPNFPFGSTNVQPVALAMKAAGVDGFIASVDANTGFALVTAMRNLGAKVKAVLPTGYGGDLLQAGPGALNSAQGVYFYTAYQPVEMNTPATRQFRQGLKNIGVTTEPTFGDYYGYMALALLVDGLKTAGPSASKGAIIAALNTIKDFNEGGLSGDHTIDMSDRAASAAGYGGCLYLTMLQGTKFKLVTGGDPVCGDVIPGLKA